MGLIRKLLADMRAARARRKLIAAMKVVASAGMYACYIKVVAGTHYLVRPDGLMYKVGKPIKQ